MGVDWVKGSQDLLEWCQRHSFPILVMSSFTGDVDLIYGDNNGDGDDDDNGEDDDNGGDDDGAP